jgi:hypothetical protein
VWDQLFEFAIVVLTIGLSLLTVHVSASLTKRQRALLLACGLMIGALAWVRETKTHRSHRKEIDEQAQEIRNLKATLTVGILSAARNWRTRRNGTRSNANWRQLSPSLERPGSTRSSSMRLKRPATKNSIGLLRE